MGSLPQQERETNDEYQARLKEEEQRRKDHGTPSEKIAGSTPQHPKPATNPLPKEEPKVGNLASHKSHGHNKTRA